MLVRLNANVDPESTLYDCFVDGELVPSAYLIDEEGGYIRFYTPGPCGEWPVIETQGNALIVHTTYRAGKVELRLKTHDKHGNARTSG